MWWAVASAVMQGLSLGSQMKGGAAAKTAAKAQKRAIGAQWEQEFLAMHQDVNAALGTQASRYAASNVTVGVGSPDVITKQTRDEYTRAVAAEAYLTQQRLKGAQAESKGVRYAQIGGYFSTLASMANTAYQYDTSKK